MKKASLALAVVGLGLVLMAGGVFAATTTSPLTISATVSSTAKLTLGAASIAFPNSDPDTTPSIAATQNPVSVTASAKTTTNGAVALTVVTGTDLTSGSDTVAIGNVTWTVTGAGYVAGTMSKSAGVSAGGWTGSGSRAGTFSYNLANSWSYPTGSYSATATYTLSCP